VSSVGPGRFGERRADAGVVVLDTLAPHPDTPPGHAEIVTVREAGVGARTATDYPESEGYDAKTLTGGYAGCPQYERNAVPYRLAAFIRRVVPSQRARNGLPNR
jgi:hypothetical protein